MIQIFPTGSELSNVDRAEIHSTQDTRLRARITNVWRLPGVKAGSSLCRFGSKLLAIQDNAFAVVEVDPQSLSTNVIALQANSDALEKHAKPDFEACVSVGNMVYIVGSGSLPSRMFVAKLFLPTMKVTVAAVPSLYGKMSAAIGAAVNIEGVVVVDNIVRFFHRGNQNQFSQIIDLPMECFETESVNVQQVQTFELGHIETVALGITDAVRSSNGVIIYSASAEDTSNAVDDGAIVGSAIGIFHPEQAPRWSPLFELDGRVTRRKIEGLVVCEQGMSGYVLTDPDDANQPAELCAYVLEGPWLLQNELLRG